MNAPPSVSARTDGEPESYRVFMSVGLLSGFNLKRGAYFMLVPLPLLAICLHFGQGVLGLALMVVAFWPLPFRCHVEAEGLRIAWLMLNERVRWEEIASIAVGADRRRGIIGKRAHALIIERRGRPPITLRGRSDVLSRLAADLADRP